MKAVTRGRVFSAGDEDKLAKVLTQDEIGRLSKNGTLQGKWKAPKKVEEVKRATGDPNALSVPAVPDAHAVGTQAGSARTPDMATDNEDTESEPGGGEAGDQT